MKENATVSIVMCTYNGEKFIREQLDSIVSQTYPIHELIIQDDCSKDATVAIIREYASRYPYIQLFQNQQNLGFNCNFKEAMLRATGEFIAISDQDDIWMNDKIARQVEAIGEHDICFTSYYGDKEFKSEGMSRVISPQYAMEYMLFYDSIPGHTMLIRNTFIRNLPVWNEHILYDWWLSMHAHLQKGLVKVDIPLNWHRPHQASAMTSLLNKHAGKRISKPTYQPYLYGISNLRSLQNKDAFRNFYTYIYKQTGDHRFRLVHKLSGLLLKKDLFSLFRLCTLCLKHKKTIYYYPHQKGAMSYVRAFFYPFIYAYSNVYFEL